MSPQAQSKSGFLSLPPEIRNYVYELVVNGPEFVIRGGSARGVEKDDPPVLRSVHSLLGVCHQIRFEVFGLIPAIESVVLVLEGFNTKKFDSWLSIMGAARMRSVRRIVFSRILPARCQISSMPAGIRGRWIDCQRTVSLDFGAQSQTIKTVEGRAKYSPGTYGHSNIVVKEETNFCSHGKKSGIDRRISLTRVPEAHRSDYQTWDREANIAAMDEIWTIVGI